ncbi:MAG: hypothetical protein ACTH4U_19670 [Pseudoalteromonas prydzensis]|uniref:hypothetical protein n=1 Tax=Pseudoalteromonas prydzensis TaxID=182141 RepID=UPI003F9648B4
MSEKFITIGSTRIKKTNIKTFGTSAARKGPTGLFGAIKKEKLDRRISFSYQCPLH